uniref:Uncharacterized protein n=1 Tax=Sinocyclocheilus grahami TaxID=75366 RepID=A0A672JYE3_SINGR
SHSESNLDFCRPAQSELIFVCANPSCWTYYHKPIFILIAGGLALAAGFVIILNSSGLFTSNSTDTMAVDDEMGPLCLSFGLMFAVFGVVWTLIIKEKVKHKRRMI